MCTKAEEGIGAKVELGGALKVCQGLNLLSNGLSLTGRDRRLVQLCQSLDCSWIISQIDFASNKNHWNILAEVQNFANPLLLNVIQSVWRVHRKTYQNDVGIWVREWSKTIVVFLAGGIPKSQLNSSAINFDIGNVVLKHRWDVNFWESTFRKNDQQTRFTAGTVTDDNQLFPDLC
ncbi:hypothetical protein OGATHE_004701 [Ogataea polymorpha]|uniref:Uncharacterized protein n=1 Tax=Ogataea polymorpha TaxID=460523 RepID=A0A9P8T2M8_9ASCO|nr:hypothetical protein OGATHE_004701 [Ogataea polymorpha]